MMSLLPKKMVEARDRATAPLLVMTSLDFIQRVHRNPTDYHKELIPIVVQENEQSGC